MDLTHFDQDGNAWMVDVSDKDITTDVYKRQLHHSLIM